MIGERLKDLRKKRGFSQVKIQMLTGIDQSNYSKLERGYRIPTLDQAVRLAIALNTSVDDILGLTDEERPYPRNARSQNMLR